MRHRARLLRYCGLVQFVGGVYIKTLRRNLSQCTWPYRQGLRIVVEKGYSNFSNSGYALFSFVYDENAFVDSYKKLYCDV